MPEKVLTSSPLSLLHWRFGVLTGLVFLGLLIVWSIDGYNIKTFIQSGGQDYGTVVIVDSDLIKLNLTNQNLTQTQQNLTVPVNLVLNQTQQNLTVPVNLVLNQTDLTKFSSESVVNLTLKQLPRVSVDDSSSGILAQSSSRWVSAELKPNFTSDLLAQWLAPGGEPCRESKTVEIVMPGLDGRSSVKLSTGEIHEFGFQALDDSGSHVCLGGDYFETDLSGKSWKSRPLVKDFGNGSYSVSFQVHPDFAGSYNFTLILLFRHFQGLKFSTMRFAYNRELRKIPIKFYKTSSKLPEILRCQKSDFTRDIWSGRWTRHAKNDDCQISKDGRYRCLAPGFACSSPWCNGSLGSLESNGWVYSTHCSFKIFSSDSAWNCLKNRWIFFWGDSNHVDTIRNILNFILDLPEIRAVPRRFDMNFSNPKNPSDTVRITSIFNGHWNETQNYQGLNSLKNEGFRNLLKKSFAEDTVPDTIIMNSGLHDGIYWSNIRQFSGGAEYAASFWREIMDSIRRRGLAVPKVFYRTTVATGGYARELSFNPSKMEAFNLVILEKLKLAGFLSGVIDNFDMTFPWHFDNRCNDGVHYGRAPLKMKWRDGEIGHQYFVDLMLAHVLLNVLCAK